MKKSIKDMRRVTLSSGETIAVEHVSGLVTSVWPGRDRTSWIEVRQRDGFDRLCHSLVPLPLDEHQTDDVSFVLGGKDHDTILAWVLWRSGKAGALPGLVKVASEGAEAPKIDPGVLGTVKFKLFAKLPARLAQIDAELAEKLKGLLASLRAKTAPTPWSAARA